MKIGDWVIPDGEDVPLRVMGVIHVEKGDYNIVITDGLGLVAEGAREHLEKDLRLASPQQPRLFTSGQLVGEAGYRERLKRLVIRV